MRNKFTVTISDVNGSRHFLLHQLIKKFLLYFTLFVALVILVGSFVILFLMHEVSSLEAKKESAVSERNLLLVQNEELQSKVSEKAQEYENIRDKISNMEEMMGLRTNEEENIDSRLEEIDLTIIQQKTFFDNIPSGDVMAYSEISSPFGWRDNPILKRKEFHTGIDLRAPIGTPILAPADGVVKFVQYNQNSGYGNVVSLSHNYGFESYYAHLQNKPVVKEGQFVKKGDMIAYSGASGMTTGPHLHYEVKFIGRILDPQPFLRWRGSNFAEIFKKEKRVTWESLIKLINAQYPLPRQPS
ncbi:peptidoglycan DD-metalloendopeptidase family protein [Sulfurospirillum diekertiae]|uniref:Cell shape determination protein CcmA n=1 Tax=Sulfurospirillum diekertiae TaxID=1854492 RepID=A0A290HW93_9BACT|nr:M23 family metallopeptidase [Sulfurospirillum diekertiae]ATB70106.1 cell shape determination protein CcmA [Sulfurospirillum diekertiae]QIR75149.1 peptidoglycan DD-metalloendopeptidase family protein [Sulfurospirillum diekertiae]QIR77813.1 peptidoglycan DD-metalloendopeptidase family protein [Sulfurospirillum diekertiae]